MSLVSSGLHLDTPETEKNVATWDEKFSTCVASTCVIPAQVVELEARNLISPTRLLLNFNDRLELCYVVKSVRSIATSRVGQLYD